MSGSMDPGLPRSDQLVFIPESVQVIHDDVEIVSSSEGAAVAALMRLFQSIVRHSSRVIVTGNRVDIEASHSTYNLRQSIESNKF